MQGTTQAATRQDAELDTPTALRVALHARDPARLGLLLAGLATEGIAADAEADLLLADIGAHEVLPTTWFRRRRR